MDRRNFFTAAGTAAALVGIRTEDEMLITDDGARLLLPQAKSLQEIFG